MRPFKLRFPAFLLIAALCAAVGCKQEPRQPASVSTDPVATTTVLADLRLLAGQQPGDHTSGSNFVIQEHGRGYAFIAEENGQTFVVHNGLSDKPFPEIGHLTLSPDGQHAAYSYLNGKRSMVVQGIAGPFYDDVWQPVFSPDSKKVAYIAQIGELSHIVIDSQVSAGTSSYTGQPVFSADSKKIVVVESARGDKNARLVVSDLSLKPLIMLECADHEAVFNETKTRVAVAALSGGKQHVVVIDLAKPERVLEEPLYDKIGMLAFDGKGVSVAYAAQRAGKHVLVFKGQEKALPDDTLFESLVIHPDGKGVGAIISSKDRYYLTEAFTRNSPAEKKYSEATGLSYSRDGSQYAYAAAEGRSVFLVVNGKEGPVYDMITKPLFSPDGKVVVYRARKNGQRFVVVSDLDGKVLREHAPHEQVFPPVFTADGKSIAYGVKDANQLIWKVEKL